MTQNLIINNDDTEFVQFTVEIPDGYAAFKIDSINGTLINQNYLKIGDKIRFTFANNPITYEGSEYGLQMRITDMSGEMEDTNPDPLAYQFLSFNTFKPYKVVFLPIYSFYDSNVGSFRYLFNPCDSSQFKYDPTNDVEDYVVGSRNNGQIEYKASFSGRFVIALEPKENIDPIDITIGESINNSKTQPEEIGTLNAAGEVITENLTASTYNYGSSWRYDVANLLMSHHIAYTVGQGLEELDLCYFIEYGDNKELITSPYDEFNRTIITTDDNVISKSVFKFYDCSNGTYLVPSFDSLPSSLYVSILEPPKINVIAVNSTKYEQISFDSSITYDNDNLPNGCKISGVNLIDSSKYLSFTITDAANNQATFEHINNIMYVKDDAFYTGNSEIIGLFEWGTNAQILNATVSFTGDPQFQIIIPHHDYTYNMIVNGNNKTCYFKHYNDESWEEFKDGAYMLGGSFTIGADGLYKFISTINTGNIPTNEYLTIDEEQILSQPLQLTSLSPGVIPSIDDLLISHVQDSSFTKDGLDFTFKDLNNDGYIISVNEEEDNDEPIISRYRLEGEHEEGDDENLYIPKVFIPVKTHNQLNTWKIDPATAPEYTRGIFMIETLTGETCINLTDSDAYVFLADGHETLNVEPIGEDDQKFKTFNGSIMFDRSSSKITRIFASSQANSAIGYINDILSARLSRYYFVASYDVFNTFINTEDKLIVSNSKDQTFSIYYDLYDNETYTGDHTILLSSCFDLVKLIGSDNLAANCMPSIIPEEHKMHTRVLSYQLISNDEVKKEPEPFIYKTFHYYNSAFGNFPYFGFSNNDKLDNSTSCGGLCVNYISDDAFIEDMDEIHKTKPKSITQRMIFINNNIIADEATKPDLISSTKVALLGTIPYASNRVSDSGFGEIFPIYRVYRNCNFEQSDLSISTGRIKTLSPIYIQSVNRITIQNILYMFDMMLHTMVKRFKSLNNSGETFNYLTVISPGPIMSLPINQYFPLSRFGKIQYTPKTQDNTTTRFIAFSFDSCLLLNYLLSPSVNDYSSLEALKSSLPLEGNEESNEEIIANLETMTALTNIQLFSSRYITVHSLRSAPVCGTGCWSLPLRSTIPCTHWSLYTYNMTT